MFEILSSFFVFFAEQINECPSQKQYNFLRQFIFGLIERFHFVFQNLQNTIQIVTSFKVSNEYQDRNQDYFEFGTGYYSSYFYQVTFNINLQQKKEKPKKQKKNNETEKIVCQHSTVEVSDIDISSQDSSFEVPPQIPTTQSSVMEIPPQAPTIEQTDINVEELKLGGLKLEELKVGELEKEESKQKETKEIKYELPFPISYILGSQIEESLKDYEIQKYLSNDLKTRLIISCIKFTPQQVEQDLYYDENGMPIYIQQEIQELRIKNFVTLSDSAKKQYELEKKQEEQNKSLDE
ncbi:hypothetical protein TTHERM_01256540 (macronuclear) [Tetrahymena thermophila SB210]|uniref:Uncharacterized protein n=1 Tax=Tetrahymena thermophila (strain SB210) TaxID=312017 RepID=Q239L3_TETTS|nr:hypothetical protein TTHERM_01256540 [Tetrahymena thermophila SB210]EAR93216.1 hypothetical protein TTHERM_01256540 [Tetrahymena thermophila SB210]|eukprot:XP_001013461.1 hypothetical protein TTHERM_01256540 [Tetrahymena thermophila SB210]